MAMINGYGLNYRQKNRAKRLKAEGLSIAQIAQKMKVTEGLLNRYFTTLSKPKPKAVAATPAPAASGQEDEHGPLPGTAAWDQLAPGEKGAITKRRNAA